jgi:PhoPQ-activated pathogenicity-related protein
MRMRELVVRVGLVLPCICISLAVAKEPVALPEASTSLQDYIKRPDPSYAWHVRQRGKQGTGEYAELILTSQTWRDVVWKHQLFVYRPAKVKDAAQALLLIDGGSWSDDMNSPADNGKPAPLPEKAQLLMLLADMMQTPIAVIRQVPEQPMFDGKKEDQIIALTFAKYFETGETDWPLLLPMVKTAVRAMDAVQEFAKQEWQSEVEHFLVTGASKRGWTTWLTAASDERVDALAPMVINMLNMAAHQSLQIESFGKYSEEISDYTERGLQQRLLTKQGASLQAIVDPIAYRKHLLQPKLIVLATNDAYWPVDALNLYWDDLQGDKYILYVPNNGHGIKDFPRVSATLAALQSSLIGGRPMPKLDWKHTENNKEIAFELTSDVSPTAVRKWSSKAATRDFREAEWTSSNVKAGSDSRKFVATFDHPEAGNTAVFLEAEFAGEPLPFVLTTALYVFTSENTSASTPAAAAQ